MPVTANGTPYTTYTATLGTENTTLYAVADAYKDNANVPVLVYAHGNGGSYQQFYGSGAWVGLRNWLIDNGWAWVECNGGGGDSWGNQQARDDYEQAYTWLTTQIDSGPVIILGRSMGGVVSYWLHTQSAVLAPVSQGLIVSSGVTNLESWIGPSPGYPVFRTALGINADGSNYQTVLDEHDPIRAAESDWTGKKVIQLWGDADTTVPPATHGEAWVTKYGDELALLQTRVRAGGDHSQANGTYLETDAMTAFITDVTGLGAPVPPEPTDVYKITGIYITGPDLLLYALTPENS